MNAILDTFLDRTVLGTARKIGPLTLVPVLLQEPAEILEVAVLDDESARVQEIGEFGVVGRLRVESLTPLPLLLVAGELVQGAKQDRLINASILIEPGGELDEVPVSCIEQGRWAYRSRRHFSTADTAAPWHLRSSATLRASRSRRRTGRHDADQRSVWQDVDAHLRKRKVRSRTANLLDAMEEAEARHKEALVEIEAWSPSEREVGAVLFVDGAPCGLEAFCSPDVWRTAGRRILRGLCADATTRDVSPDDAPRRARDLIERVRSMSTTKTNGMGLGTELHGETEHTHLTALTAAPGQLSDDCPGGVIHLRLARLETEAQADTPRQTAGPFEGRKAGLDGEQE